MLHEDHPLARLARARESAQAGIRKHLEEVARMINPEQYADLKVRFDVLLCMCGRFKGVVEAVINPVKDKFFSFPASISGFHQCYRHGLFQHTVEMAEQVVYLSKFYDVDVELVVAAALIHDVGKVVEYDRNSYDADLDDDLVRSEAGKLVGHVSIGHAMLSKVCDDVDLRHCVLSHHGRHEWGSPVEPKTREAWLVHLVDMISSRVGGKPNRPNSEVKKL